MNPYVWRFIGGYATSLVIDRMIPDYYRHAAQGANVMIWGASTRRGRASEFAGRQITRGAKAVARPVARIGGRLMMRVGGRLVPVIGWYLAAADALYFTSYMVHKSGVKFYNPTPLSPDRPIHEEMDKLGIGWGMS